MKGQPQGKVTLSLSSDADFAHMTRRVVDFARIVSLGDPERFIHLTVSEDDQRYTERMGANFGRLTQLTAGYTPREIQIAVRVEF